MPEAPLTTAGGVGPVAEQAEEFGAELKLLRALEGNALGRLYDRHHAAVYRYIAVRVRRIEDAEDLAEEVFLSAIQALPRLQAVDRSGLSAWLLRIARNKVVDHYRRSSHRDTDELPETAKAPTSFQPEVRFEMLASSEVLRDGLKQLTEEQREVLVSKYVLGYDNLEIAAATGRTSNAVNALHYRGLATLRRLLEKGGTTRD